MADNNRINEYSNVKQHTSVDQKVPSIVTTDAYTAVSTSGQTTISLPWSVDLSNTDNFKLFVNGNLLTMGSSFDYTFINPVQNTSNTIQLNSPPGPLTAGLNINAYNENLVKQLMPTPNSLQAQINANTTDIATLNSEVANPVTSNYWSGYMLNTTTWSTTSTSPVDPTPSGLNTLTTRISNGITFAAAASNLPGITFTPSSTTATYEVTASFGLNNNGEWTFVDLFDGTNIITSNFNITTGGDASGITLTGLWKPGTISPITIKIQMAVSGNTGTIVDAFTFPNTGVIDWSVVQIAP